MRNISPLCLCTDHFVVLLCSIITSLQEISWIAGGETSGDTDIMLLFYEPAEYHKFSFNSPFKYRSVCVSVYTERPRRNVPDFGRVFLMLKYTDIT